MGVLVFLLLPLGSERRERDKRGGGRIEKCCFFPLVFFPLLYKGLKLYIDTSPSNFPPTTRKNKKIKLSWTRIFFEALLTLLDVERNISFFPRTRCSEKKISFRKCQQGRWGGKRRAVWGKKCFSALKFLTQDATVRKKRTLTGPFQDPDPASSCTFRKFEWQACMPRFPPPLLKNHFVSVKKPSRV